MTSAPPAYTESPPSYSDKAPLLANAGSASSAGYTQAPDPSGAPQGNRFPRPQFRDVPYALLFVLVVLGFMVFTAIAWHKTFVEAHESKDAQGHNTSGTDLNSDNLRKMGRIAAYCTVIGLVLTGVAVEVLKKWPKQCIIGVLVINCLLCLAIAAMFFAAGILIGGIIWLIISLISIVFYFLWRWRIPFAAEMLHTTTSVLKMYPGMIGFAFLGLFSLIVWIVIWIFGASAAANLNNAGLYIFCVFTFYWVHQVIKNVVHVTSAGTYASWYFMAGTAAMPVNPSMGAAKRAVTTSFGSICLGSLIIALIETTRFILESARRNNRNQFIAACALCLLGCIERLVEYFNRYAYAQVAIYGKPFCTAAKDTWNLFKTHGIDIIVNDDIIGPVLGFASFIVGVAVALVAFLWGWHELGTSGDQLGYLIALVVICFFIGFIECITVMEVINSGIATVLVSFAEAPHILQEKWPDLYARFAETYGPRIGFLSMS